MIRFNQGGTITPFPSNDPLINALWGDEFNYTVARASITDTANNLFTDGPWTVAKTEEADAGARGYIYTVDPTTDIPGNTINPAARSSRVLCMEALPATLGAQTDFYLQRYDADYNNVLPADCWIQQWLYIPRSGAQMSQVSTSGLKFWYPCRGIGGSCNTMSWLTILKEYAANPTCANVGSTNGFYLIDIGDSTLAGDTHTYSGTCGGEPAHERGPESSAYYMQFNNWYLLKAHYNVSGTQGSQEVWIRQYGSPTWVKFFDWRGGVYPGDYSFSLAAGNQNVGHTDFRLITTVNTYDSWLYMADFAVATSEGALHVYSDA